MAHAQLAVPLAGSPVPLNRGEPVTVRVRCVRFLGSAIVGVLVVGLVALAGFSASMGPLGPAYAPFAENDATFPEDTVNAGASCDEFRVGVAKRDIVPGFEVAAGVYSLWQEPFEDTNGNGVYDAPNPLAPDDHFDPFTDENGNLKWDGPYMAGYGHRKANNQYYTAASVHDPVWARALAFECGSLLVGLVSLDVVGFFQHEVWDVRARVADVGFDHVIVASTHTHDSVDTMGLWGPNEVTDGKDPRTQENIKAKAAEALREAAANLEPVMVSAGAHGTQDPAIVDWAGYVQTDLRDPFVIDDVVLAAQFIGASGTVATLVNWSPHPETLAGTRSEISSDFADQLRRSVESEGAVVGGVSQAPLGGTAVYFSGAVGGMMTTLGARVFDEQGSPLGDYGYEKAERIGEVAAWAALAGLEAGPNATVDGMRVQVREVTFPIDNAFLAALNTIGVFDHPVALGPAEIQGVDAVGSGVVAPIPFIRTELNVVTLTAQGEPFVQIVTVPGELLPEVAIGSEMASDGEASWETCYAFNGLKLAVNGNRNGNYNPATRVREGGFERILSAHGNVPQEPPIRDSMEGKYKFLFGLANDELGYIVPANDFMASTPAWFDGPYLESTDRCGDDDHYEETVSASSLLAPVIANNFAQMLDPDFEPAAYPTELGGVLGNPADVEGLTYGESVGLWLDTSGSNGYESQEDAHVRASLPSHVSGAWGFVDGNGRDMGQEPGEDTKGLWIDLNGNESLDEADGVVFVDHWALGE